MLGQSPTYMAKNEGTFGANAGCEGAVSGGAFGDDLGSIPGTCIISAAELRNRPVKSIHFSTLVFR